MRPSILEYLQRHGWGLLANLVPTPGMVYTILLLVLAYGMVRRSRELQLDLPRLTTDRALESVLAAAVGAGIGTRLFYLLTSGAILRLDFITWFSPSTGTASWGAYLGGVLGLIAYARWRSLPPLRLLDAATSIAPLSEVIGRWSCFLAGDDFGRISNVPWAIRYPTESLAWKAHVARGEIERSALTSLPVHPVQFYLMVNAVVVLIIVTLVWRRWRRVPGVTTGAWLMAHGLTRFWWEFFRDPAAGGAESGLSVSQWTCIGFAGAGLAILLVQRRARLQQNQTSASAV
ncbi:MAG: prolipoprotein diacylglyceryl transferase family protein [Gemmatimonadota bacterium]